MVGRGGWWVLKALRASTPTLERCSSAGWTEGLPAKAFGSRLHAFTAQKRFRIKPCETPKFRIPVKVEGPGKEKVGWGEQEEATGRIPRWGRLAGPGYGRGKCGNRGAWDSPSCRKGELLHRLCLFPGSS